MCAIFFRKTGDLNGSGLLRDSSVGGFEDASNDATQVGVLSELLFSYLV